MCRDSNQHWLLLESLRLRKSGFQENFSCGIRNPWLWNLNWNSESNHYWQKNSGIQYSWIPWHGIQSSSLSVRIVWRTQYFFLCPSLAWHGDYHIFHIHLPSSKYTILFHLYGTTLVQPTVRCSLGDFTSKYPSNNVTYLPSKFTIKKNVCLGGWRRGEV